MFGANWPGQLMQKGIISNPELCNAVCITIVLFLPAMYIWSDLQVHSNLGLLIFP
jgi:hypothetical protein